MDIVRWSEWRAELRFFYVTTSNMQETWDIYYWWPNQQMHIYYSNPPPQLLLLICYTEPVVPFGRRRRPLLIRYGPMISRLPRVCNCGRHESSKELYRHSFFIRRRYHPLRWIIRGFNYWIEQYRIVYRFRFLWTKNNGRHGNGKELVFLSHPGNIPISDNCKFVRDNRLRFIF